MTIADDIISHKIIDALCVGKKPHEIRTELGLGQSVFESRFEALREAACLPKEKRAYVACADLVQANLAKLDSFSQSMELAKDEFKSSLHQFNY